MGWRDSMWFIWCSCASACVYACVCVLECLCVYVWHMCLWRSEDTSGVVPYMFPTSSSETFHFRSLERTDYAKPTGQHTHGSSYNRIPSAGIRSPYYHTQLSDTWTRGNQAHEVLMFSRLGLYKLLLPQPLCSLLRSGNFTRNTSHTSDQSAAFL